MLVALTSQRLRTIDCLSSLLKKYTKWQMPIVSTSTQNQLMNKDLLDVIGGIVALILVFAFFTLLLILF